MLRPGPDQVLIHLLCSSLNPLKYKLAELNFPGRTPPVILGFDLALIVIDTGELVREFSVGDEVMAMADLNGDGGWSVGSKGGYSLARQILAALRGGEIGKGWQDNHGLSTPDAIYHAATRGDRREQIFLNEIDPVPGPYNSAIASGPGLYTMTLCLGKSVN